MAGAIEVKVPDIGDFKDVEVIEILVKPGDGVSKEQSLITLESDKATMEIPSPMEGVVQALNVKVGDRVSEGTPILSLENGVDAGTGTGKAPTPLENEAQPPENESAGMSSPEANDAGTQTVRVPDIGDFKDVEVIEVLVRPGERIAMEQSLVTLESDKATMEIPSPGAGVVQALAVKVGDRVAEGSAVLTLKVDAPQAEAPVPQPERQAPAQPAAPAATPSAQAPGDGAYPAGMHARPVPREPREETVSTAHASPSVRKFARELGVDLLQVKGNGPRGRILHEDVQAFVKASLAQGAARLTAPAAQARVLPYDLPSWPEVDFAKFGPVELQPLSRIQRLSGPNLHRNWISIPHVTQFDEADITELEAFRKDNSTESQLQGFKLTMLAFLIKASVTALRQYPKFNASLATGGGELAVKKYYHIGVAVDTPEGLVVPVIRDADRKGVFDLAKELADISGLAREKKLKPGDMQGGTFSISSLGGIGGTAFTPIINAPEVAILGVSRSSMRPVWDGKQFVPRLMLPLSLSYDHRVIDGASAARFTSYLASVLSDIRRSLL